MNSKRGLLKITVRSHWQELEGNIDFQHRLVSLTGLGIWKSPMNSYLIPEIRACCNKAIGEKTKQCLSSNSMGHKRLKACSVLQSSAVYVSRDRCGIQQKPGGCQKQDQIALGQTSEEINSSMGIFRVLV